jgi:hypothetical protein
MGKSLGHVAVGVARKGIEVLGIKVLGQKNTSIPNT